MTFNIPALVSLTVGFGQVLKYLNVKKGLIPLASIFTGTVFYFLANPALELNAIILTGTYIGLVSVGLYELVKPVGKTLTK